MQNLIPSYFNILGNLIDAFGLLIVSFIVPPTIGLVLRIFDQRLGIEVKFVLTEILFLGIIALLGLTLFPIGLLGSLFFYGEFGLPLIDAHKSMRKRFQFQSPDTPLNPSVYDALYDQRGPHFGSAAADPDDTLNYDLGYTGVKRCWHCGTRNKNHAQRCSACGSGF